MISKTSTTANDEIQYIYVPETLTIGRYTVRHDKTKPDVVSISINATMIGGEEKYMNYDVDVVKFQNALECLWEPEC